MKFILSVLCMFCAWFTNAQKPQSPVDFTFEIAKDGDRTYLLAHAKIERNWNIYALTLEEDGPIPTSITIENGAKAKGDAVEIGERIEKYSELFFMNVAKFENQVTFKQEIIPNGTQVTGYITFMACDAKKCLPPTDIYFKLTL